METEQRNPVDKPEQQELRRFFLSHLNRIYCAKLQLLERLPELGRRSHFLDLRQAIDESIEIVGNQLGRMREIYILLDAFYQPESCVGLIGILDEAFQSIGTAADSPSMGDLSLLFYMQNIESIEMSAFKMMILVASKIGVTDIEQLLTECFDEAKDDKLLLKQITANYL